MAKPDDTRTLRAIAWTPRVGDRLGVREVRAVGINEVRYYDHGEGCEVTVDRPTWRDDAIHQIFRMEDIRPRGEPITRGGGKPKITVGEMFDQINDIAKTVFPRHPIAPDKK